MKLLPKKLKEVTQLEKQKENTHNHHFQYTFGTGASGRPDNTKSLHRGVSRQQSTATQFEGSQSRRLHRSEAPHEWNVLILCAKIAHFYLKIVVVIEPYGSLSRATG